MHDRSTSRNFLRAARRVAALALSVSAGALGLLAAAKPAADSAKVATSLTPEGGRIVVDVQGVPPAVPAFFSAQAEQLLRVGLREVVGETRLALHVVQGRPEVFSLGISGDGEVVEVSGAGLRDWSVRRAADGKRFLDLRSAPLATTSIGSTISASGPTDLDLTVRLRVREPALGAALALPLLTPGDAVGFAAKITLQPDASAELRVTGAAGLLALGDARSPQAPQQFAATGDARLEVKLAARGGASAEAELLAAQLSGKVNEAAGSVEFRLRGQFRVQKIGARLRLLTGRAALSEKSAGDGWHVELVALAADRIGNQVAADRGFAYELVGDREGTFALELPFAAVVREDGDWRTLDFAMPAGAVVPLQLEGLAAGVNFKPEAPIVPVATAAGWQGFLPADGGAALAWKHTREAGEGALFFTSSEQTEVRVGAGLLRQTAQLSFRVLQGKLGSVRFRLEGPGAVLGVEGVPPFGGITGWKVLPADGGARVLEVQFSRPVETEAALVVQSQAELGAFPVRAEPLRVTPEGGVRHSGFVRVANQGAVRLEVADASGMMQLAPAQFPGAAAEKGARQVFVYRFPSAGYGYRVLASQIQPEVGVSQIATYALAETDRTIQASLELDVREAPLRDWTLLVPADYTVAAVTGADVADYVAESSAADSYRALRILFSRAIDGRQLLQLRLEKNQPAAAGDWTLPALRFPGAKSVRGHIGAVATPGYRLAPAISEKLVEVPLSLFPQPAAGLQQAWRLRDADWSAGVRIEALGQSVQADVFHLYTLKEGVVYGSVLLNYFVVGAPATEWRVAVPAGVGNIDVTGQNVRRDWRREGDTVIVSLHQPVLGAATLLVTFEQPMSARGGVLQPGEVRPLGVQAERGYVQVVSPLQVKHEVRRADGGLLKLEPLELPAEFRLLSSSPTLAVYQYTARPFALELGVEWYAPGETVEQVVDFAKLSSRVSRDGQVVTDARFFVKTRGRKALRLVLPAGAKLWEARVDDEIVNARADGEHTLVPLPAKLNPNEPVAVTLRLGHAAGASATALQLVAPRTVAPTVINEWTLHADSGRLLVPRGGNAELKQPALTETGFEWISRRGFTPTLFLLAMIACAVLLLRAGSGWKTPAGVLMALVAVFATYVLAREAWFERRVNVGELTYATTMVPAGENVTVELANIAPWRAMLVGWGIAAAALGAAAATGGWWLARRGAVAGRWIAAAGWLSLALGALAQHGGAVVFFLGLALTLVQALILPEFFRWRRERLAAGEPPPPPPLPETGGHSGAGPSAGPGAVLPLLALFGATLLGLGGAPAARADLPPVTPMPWLQDGAKPAQSIVQTWTIRDGRLFAELEITVRGAAGDSFLLLRAPAVLTEFKGDGLRLGKAERDGATAYFVAPERDGLLTARAKFELPVPERAETIALPTGAAATQRVTLTLEQGGWEFTSPTAVQVLPTAGLAENRSGATLVLAPSAAPVIRLQPKRRNAASEAVQFFAESANLFVPGPGVVSGHTRVNVRPVQGRVSELVLEIPAGLTVGDVGRGPVGAWRFDPVKRRLQVAVEPAQTEPFAFTVATQLGAAALPFDLALEPLRTAGASGDVGLLALAFGGDAQPEGVRAHGLSTVNVQDFDAALLPRTRDGQPLATLQHAWRYGPAGGRVELKVAPVAPEVRVTTRQVFSLDDDRLVLAVDLKVAITRVGLFKLSFALPAGLEVEALSGAALSHWTEAVETSGQRVVTLHLNGRTLGEQAFTLSLAGAAPRAQDAWVVPRLALREATRQTGELLLVPGKGLRLRSVEREKVTQLDPRTVGGMQPGTLAFNLLQDDWTLRVGVEALDPWVTVAALQETTVREGQTLTRLGLRYRVENAAVKHVRVRLPGLDGERARTVRATGPAVSDMVKVPGDGDLWEIRFQRGIAGEAEVQIEFQGAAAPDPSREAVATPEFVGARSAVQFVAVRGGGRLELEAAAPPRGWTRVDWSAVPANLQNRADRSVPALCFRVAEPERALDISVRRHDVAEALKLRVTQGGLTTLFAPSGAFLTAADLNVDVLEKGTLRVRLPEGAQLFNTLVNGESVSVVREGDAYLFYVTPDSAGSRRATVRLVYAAHHAPHGGVELTGPGLSAPLENVTWRVVLPPGYELSGYDGGLRLREDHEVASFGLADYQSAVSSRRSEEAKRATEWLKEANTLLQRGEQQKAGEYFNRASNAAVLDEASNEDARVQLKKLKTEQTVLSLNTRRQKLYLGNRADAARNEQLEQAATLNPILQGNLNFNSQDLDQLLGGNTVEENSALRGIAARLVEQQLAAEPSPGAIDVTLAENGRVLTFTRSLQVDGAAPLALHLRVARASGTDRRFVSLLLLAVAAIVVCRVAPRKELAA